MQSEYGARSWARDSRFSRRLLKPRGTKLGVGLAFLLLLLGGVEASAQNYGTDARRIGMGSIGGRSNPAWALVPPARAYRSVPVPLGLFQVLGDLDSFDPGSDAFNPARALDYAASPMHFTFDRGGSAAGDAFISDIVNGAISRDLNAYRGFAPRSDVAAAGLLAPNWGKTLRLFEAGDMFHGVHLGAGPYVSVGTDLDFDDNLIGVFGSSTDVYLPNTSFSILNATRTQAALSFHGGYRARLPLPAFRGPRDGLYVAADYRRLHGLSYQDFDLAVQFDTDDDGLLTLLPATTPVAVDRFSSSGGSGFAVDVAAAVVLDRWDFTFAAAGVGNRIDWRNPRGTRYTLSSVIDGADFVETPLPALESPLRVELPIRYSGGMGYDADGWAAGVELAQGLQDFEFNAGAEYRLGLVDLRGGGRYSRDLWHPAGGVGLNLTRGFGVDFGVYGTATGIERARKAALAVSLRFNQER